jgi:hypothetical protein
VLLVAVERGLFDLSADPMPHASYGDPRIRLKGRNIEDLRCSTAM